MENYMANGNFDIFTMYRLAYTGAIQTKPSKLCHVLYKHLYATVNIIAAISAPEYFFVIIMVHESVRAIESEATGPDHHITFQKTNHSLIATSNTIRK